MNRVGNKSTLQLSVRTLLVLTWAVTGISGLSLSFTAWGGNLSRILPALLVLSIVVPGCRAVGRFLLRRILREPEDPVGEVFISIGIGFFVLEMITFTGAAIQCLYPVFGWVIFLGLMVPTALFECFRKRKPLSVEIPYQTVLIVVFSIGAGIFLLASCVPPRLYDALEYHLGAPWQWIVHGGFYKIDGNVFSNFPFNIEMLYTFSLLIFPGGELATLFHWMMGVLVALGIVHLGERVGCRKSGLLAAFLFYFSLPVLELSIGANIDLGVGFAALVAVLCLFHWNDSPTRGRLMTAGAAVGIVLGCKYTAVLIVFLPALVVVGYRSFGWSNGTLRVVVSNCAVFSVLAFATFSPWLIKNLIYNGNPVFPLLYGLFGGEGWSKTEAAIFAGAVDSGFSAGISGLKRTPIDVWRFLTGGTLALSLLWLSVLLWLPLRLWLPLPEKHSKKTSALRIAFLMGLSAHLLWLVATYRVVRFIVPVFPLILVAGVCSVSLRFRKPMVPLFVTALAFAAWQIPLLGLALGDFGLWGGWDYLAGRKDPYEINRSLGYAPLIKTINELPRAVRPKILFVGEARAFGVRYPVELSTVFNHSSFLARYEREGSVKGLVDSLRNENFTHVLVNEIELNRFHDFYHGNGWNERDEILRIAGEFAVSDGVHLADENRTPKGRILLFRLR